MSAEVVAVRCIACATPYPQPSPQIPATCPACGDDGIPAVAAEDVTVAINWRELQLLVQQADARAVTHADPARRKALRQRVLGVARRLQAQHPGLEELAPFAVLDTEGADGKLMREFFTVLNGGKLPAPVPGEVDRALGNLAHQRELDTEAERQLCAYYERHRGAILAATVLYVDPLDYAREPLRPARPVRVRLLDTPDHELFTWFEPVVLTHWRVEPLDWSELAGLVPANAPRPALWVMGPAGQVIDDDGVQVVDDQLAFVVVS